MGDVHAAFEGLVGDLDYPMYVVTAFDGTRRAGCLVGFTTQASIDPPRFLVMVSKANETFEVASRADVLVVHFLGENDKDLAELFGEQSGDWTDKFAQCEWKDGPGGAPVLAGVRGWVAGQVLQRFDVGDHVGHLLEPIEADIAGDGPPLMFKQVIDIDPGHPA